MSESSKVDISDLPYSVVLAALYNNAVVSALGRRTSVDGFMSIKLANSILSDRRSAAFIQELYGRVIGVDFTEPEFDPTTYDQANPNGMTAAQVVARVRQFLTQELLADAIKDYRKDALRAARGKPRTQVFRGT